MVSGRARLLPSRWVQIRGSAGASPSRALTTVLFFPDNQDHKRAWLVGTSAALAPSRWSGLLLGRAQIDRMRFGIESHGPGARLRPHIRHDGKLVRSFLRDDSQGAVTVGAECELVVRIEGAGVGSFPNGKRGND